MLIAMIAVALAASPGSPVGDGSGSGPGRIYTYESFSDTSNQRSRIVLDFERQALIYPGTYVELKHCGPLRPVCFTSTRMTFCAPKAADIKAGQWGCEVGESDLKVKGQTQLYMLGHEVDVLVIEGRDVEYYYSSSRGLVMLRFSANQIAEVYWSASDVGFGAEGGGDAQVPTSSEQE